METVENPIPETPDISGRFDAIDNRLNAQESSADDLEKRNALIGEEITKLNSAIANKLVSLDDTLKPFNTMLAEIKAAYDENFAKPDPTIKNKAEKLAEHHSLVENFQSSSLALKKEIEEFRDFVYGNQEAKIKGFKQNVEDLERAHKDLYGTQKIAFDGMFEKIEGLLPGATATGLAKAYEDQKKGLRTPVIIWSLIFIATLGVMLSFANVTYDPSATLTETLLHLLTKLPFVLPAVWLAYWAAKKQNQSMRLLQEYSYKETLAKSYEGHKRELDKLPEGAGKNELLLKHLTAMVTMFGFNPSLTLEHKSHRESPSDIWRWGKRKEKDQAKDTDTSAL